MCHDSSNDSCDDVIVFPLYVKSYCRWVGRLLEELEVALWKVKRSLDSRPEVYYT